MEENRYSQKRGKPGRELNKAGKCEASCSVSEGTEFYPRIAKFPTKCRGY